MGSCRRDLLLGMALALAAPSLVAPVTAQETLSTPTAGDAIVVAGSATVGPILQAAADAFAQESKVEVAVERSSSGAGLARFCAGETDLATSGRRIKAEEAATCAETGVAYDEFEVAFDGVAVVVNPANDAVDCLSAEQLGRLWAPDSEVQTWKDLDPEWPAESIALYGTGGESGTYQFFTEAVVGEEAASRDDYTVTAGHPDTAEGVAADENGLGFLPFPRYVENRDRLKLVAVDGGDGCVEPSAATIRDGSYAPVSRPLFVYAKRASLERPEVADFLRFYVAAAAAFAEEAGLVASSEEVYETNQARLEDAIAGASPPAAGDLGATPAA